MATSVWVFVVLSALCVVLGFIALLTQKIYLDKDTSQPTEIEVKGVGKLKTNYPAVVLLVLGAGAGYAGFAQLEGKELWIIRGSFENPNHNTVNWEYGTATVHPAVVRGVKFYNSSDFEMELLIEEGKSFEEAIESIQFTFDSASFVLRPAEEMKKTTSKLASLLTGQSPHERTYKIHPAYFNEGN